MKNIKSYGSQIRCPNCDSILNKQSLDSDQCHICKIEDINQLLSKKSKENDMERDGDGIPENFENWVEEFSQVKEDYEQSKKQLEMAQKLKKHNFANANNDDDREIAQNEYDDVYHQHQNAESKYEEYIEKAKIKGWGDNKKPRTPIKRKKKYKSGSSSDFTSISNIIIIISFGFCAYLFFLFISEPSKTNYFKKIIAENLNDPSSIDIREYSGPYDGNIFLPTSGNKGTLLALPSFCSTLRTYTVKVSAKNVYGGRVVTDWSVIVKDGKACGVFQLNENFALWYNKSTLSPWAPDCNCN